jgi:uncharacterized protein (TIGR02598 family)
MNPFLFPSRKKSARGGFSLVEATLSLGLMSFGFLALSPLLILGLKTSHDARDDRTSAQIAQTLIEEAKQGTITEDGSSYLDYEGNPVSSVDADYTALATFQPISSTYSVKRLTLRVTPRGAPDRAQTYAVLFLSSK